MHIIRHRFSAELTIALIRMNFHVALCTCVSAIDLDKLSFVTVLVLA